MTEDIKGMWNKLDITLQTSQTKIKKLITAGKKAFLSGNYLDAIQHFLESINDDPENLEGHYYLGLLYTKTADLNRALIHFNEIMMSTHRFLHKDQVQIILGYIYALQEDFQSAKENLNEVLKEYKDNIKLLSILGYVAVKEKDYAKATEIYTQILSLEGENANAYNSLGFIFIESGENIDRGIATCKRALEIKPDTPAYFDSIGWGYYKKGEEAEAIKYLKLAFEKAPDNQEIKEHLKILLNI